MAEARHKHLNEKTSIHETCFIAPGAHTIGGVTLEEGVSVWYNCVLRADIARIKVGKHSNVQDGTVLHVDENEACVVGEHVTIGHNCIVHSAKVGNHALIGMGATLLSGCEIGEGAMVGAGALVKENFKVPPGTLAVGVPAKVIRKLTPEEQAGMKENARHYSELCQVYRSQK